MTWTSFTKATMQGRCSSTSKWVLTTTERKDTKSLRMRLPLIIRLTHGYWINWYLLIIDIYHRISIYISIIASLRRQMRTEQPTRTSRSRSLPRGAWWQCKPSTRYKYKCKPSASWLRTYLYFALIWPKKQLVICDLFDQDLVIWPRTALQPNLFKSSKKKLFITDGTDATLTGYCMYFLRWCRTSFRWWMI